MLEFIFTRHLFSYLERAVSRLSDPYEMAIVTYALTLANSPAKEFAFNRMHKMRRESGKSISSIANLIFETIEMTFL